MIDLLRQLSPQFDGPLPSTVFFQPNAAFTDYIKEVRGDKPIIDVGAGLGRMSKVLTDAGVPCIALDIAERDNMEYPVIRMDGLNFPFKANQLPVVARPCHGLWVKWQIHYIMERCPMMLYVGLRRNFADDLHEMAQRYKVVKLTWAAGVDGERVVEIKRKL